MVFHAYQHDRDLTVGQGVQRPVPSTTGRLYVQQDANWNVTAVTNTSGAVQERYIYDVYGTATRLTATWTAAGTDTIRFNYLDQGGRFDQVTQLIASASAMSARRSAGPCRLIRLDIRMGPIGTCGNAAHRRRGSTRKA
jgi:hypothetical protein